MSASVASAGAAPARVGGYAQGDVEVAGSGQPGELLELALAAPFGALFSALFPGQPVRVRSLALSYSSLERLGATATFSAKLTELREGGEARLSLVIFRGPRVCVRGEAVIVLGSPGASSAVAPSSAMTNGKSSSGRTNGERHS